MGGSDDEAWENINNKVQESGEDHRYWAYGDWIIMVNSDQLNWGDIVNCYYFHG